MPRQERETRDHEHHERDAQGGQGTIPEGWMRRDLADVDGQGDEQQARQSGRRTSGHDEEGLPPRDAFGIDVNAAEHGDDASVPYSRPKPGKLLTANSRNPAELITWL